MLVRFILFLLVFYLIYFLVKKLFARPFSEGYNKNARRSPGGKRPFERKGEGEVTITYDPSRHKKGDRSAGDYVDYEEVKD